MTRHAATDAVSELIRPHRALIRVTPTVHYHVTAPCLLRQLVECVGVGSERGGRGVPGSRAPANVDVLDLWHAIVFDAYAWAVVLAVSRRDPGDDHPIPWVGRLLRQVAAAAISRGEEDMAAMVARRAKDWARDITAMVTGEPEQRGVRGAVCPDCEATRVVEDRDGESFRVPAIVLVVRAIEDRPLRWLSCRACGWHMGLGEDVEGEQWTSEAA